MMITLIAKKTFKTAVAFYQKIGYTTSRGRGCTRTHRHLNKQYFPWNTTFRTWVNCEVLVRSLLQSFRCFMTFAFIFSFHSSAFDTTSTWCGGDDKLRRATRPSPPRHAIARRTPTNGEPGAHGLCSRIPRPWKNRTAPPSQSLPSQETLLVLCLFARLSGCWVHLQAQITLPFNTVR